MKLLSYLLLMLWAISMLGCGSGSNDGSSSISAPKIVSVTPLNGAGNVSRISDIVVTFDQSIDPNTVEATSINVKDDQNYQVEADAVVVNTNEVTFKPKHRLPAGRRYTITIAPTIKSVFGTAMSAEYTSAFTSKTSEWNSTENLGEASYAVTAMDKYGNMIIVWWRFNPTNGHYEIVMSQSHGGVWSDPQVISGDATNVYHPDVAMDNNGNAIIVWEDWGTGRGVVKTEFRAGTWSQPEVITAPGVSFSPGSSPSVTMNDQGRAAIVWSQSNIYKKEYANGAWSAPSAVSTGGGCSDPRVSINSKSNFAVTWHYRDGYYSHSKLFSRVCLNGAWSDAAIVSIAGTDPDSFYNLAFDSNDNAIVVWGQWDGTIRRAYRNEYRNGSWAGPVPLSSQGAESNYPTVTMDNRGNAIIAWQQRVNNISQIVISESRAGVWNAPTQVSSAVTSADVPMVKMDSSGNGVLLWNQASGADRQVYRMQYLNGVWTDKSVMAVSNNQLNHVSYDIATDGSGDTGIVWSQSDGARWNLYRTFYHSDDSNYSSAVGAGSPSGGYSGGFSGGGAGGTGEESSINVSNWYWLNPKTSGNNLGNVAYGAGKYVAIGNAGVIAISSDGSTWTLQNSGTSINLRRVVYGGGRFVAIGNYGTILSSTDGVTWQPQASGTTTNLTGAIYNSGQFIVVGDSGTILTSPDGGAWTSRTSGITNSLLDVTYGNNQYVISGSAGLILTSSDGVTWSSRDSRTTIVLNGVAYGSGLFVAVGNAGTVQTSPDGINWATQAAAWVAMPGFSFKPNFVAVTHDGAQFVAVGLSGVVQTSPNGINWTSRSSGTLNNLNGVNNVGGQTVAAGDGGTVLASIDGNSWTGTSGSTDKLSSVIFSGSQFLTAGWSGGIGIIMTSPDGLTWTKRDTHSGSPVTSIAYGNGTYVGATWGSALTSPDGMAWTFLGQAGGTSITYGGGVFVLVGSSGSILTSPDGSSWSVSNSGTTNSLAHVTYGGGQFVAVGATGTILTSLDGTTWTRRISSTSYPLSGVYYGGGKYVAIGESGTLLTSDDGLSWISRSSGTTSNLSGITYGGGQYVVVGTSGTILASSDGVSWTKKVSYTTNNLNGVTYDGNGHFVIVGNSGTILGNY